MDSPRKFKISMFSQTLKTLIVIEWSEGEKKRFQQDVCSYVIKNSKAMQKPSSKNVE